MWTISEFVNNFRICEQFQNLWKLSDFWNNFRFSENFSSNLATSSPQCTGLSLWWPFFHAKKSWRALCGPKFNVNVLDSTTPHNHSETEIICLIWPWPVMKNEEDPQTPLNLWCILCKGFSYMGSYLSWLPRKVVPFLWPAQL